MAQANAAPRNKPSDGKPIDLDLIDTMVGKGVTGLVQLLPCGTRVRKAPVPWASDYMMQFQREQLRREIQVYKNLPAGHRRLVRMLDYNSGEDGNEEEEVSVTLEYMPNISLLRYLTGVAKFIEIMTEEEEARGAAIPLRQRASWALEATDGVVMLHEHDVIHADIRPENMGLDTQLHVRLIDFSGSSLCGARAMSLESASFYMPRDRGAAVKMNSSVTTDLFALGSSFYQMLTCFPPWYGVPHDEIEARFKQDEFPDLATAGPDGGPLLFADIIRQCWHAEIASAADVLALLKARIRESFDADDQAFIEQQSGIPLQE